MKNRNYLHKTDPLKHQISVISRIAENNAIALFDEQGLGKTKMVLAALINNMKNKEIDAALVICKNNLLYNWDKEIKTHTNLKSIIISGTLSGRRRIMQLSVPFYLIGYQSAIREKEILKDLLGIKRFAIILDESHVIKNPLAAVTSTCLDLGKYAKKHIILSGTPIANSPEDIWTQFMFLGVALEKSYQDFKDKYAIKIHQGDSKYNLNALTELKSYIEEKSIRRLKTDVIFDLPNKLYKYISVEMKGKQLELYSELRDNLLIEIKEMNGNKVIDEAKNILKRIIRLNQIASNPILVDKSYYETPAKFKVIDELIEDIISNNEKAIIWTNYVENVDILNKRYKKYNSVHIHGAISIFDRNKYVNRFQNEDDCKILVANPSAAREGLTLTASNNAIYLDRSFNMVDYLQSQDRIHRISQKKICNIIVIKAKNTIDDYIDDVIYKKSQIAKYIQGDTNSIDIKDSFLTKDDIIKILGG